MAAKGMVRLTSAAANGQANHSQRRNLTQARGHSTAESVLPGPLRVLFLGTGHNPPVNKDMQPMKATGQTPPEVPGLFSAGDR